ncbi:DUF1294 domain-containing protein [Salisediminibacterium halotolerans]|uniref:DUF1294 domain-containing protein n=1 Tax=Salisediminibacterium halotolerans TaxID=517425 RepID=UPI000EAB7883|nr:DUF1294 domain-containing protein [Salisediminibacterium halotolerans]RLJ80854.1 uncharacterized membrane protein YsdA (DUF1294 family) [Actinophytocola xinjiangensis]RPE84047.1 uncharacterized membrane protein YsdA (DUF1294 family) [Salisediminibacterium halotolerans]TWG37801.1 uncharacterized membrane protein YsdA (DUF1294 family) [Salisediminibacterium halotolerans]GEL08553.1 hypothetical protein SHA02_19690 [Salisediminibacterium halotolerans]
MVIAVTALYAGFVSVIGIIFMIVDKRRAVRKHKNRISERTLLLTAACGAAMAMWLTGRQIRHKTKKPLFRWGLPILSGVHLAAAGTVYFSG